MRLRNVKYAKELIHSYPDYVVLKPKNHKGKWRDLFENKKPIQVEIGCGKGKFIYESGLYNPEKNFIGIEKFDSVIVRALEKLILEPLDNVKLIRFDATHINDIFKENEVEHLYLNFSDPWPKLRHSKRRLTSPQFLEKYHHILKDGAIIDMKTDNYALFEYSLMMFNQSDYFAIIDVSLDLYKDLPATNIQTEFEMKFVEENNAIYYIKAQHKGEIE
ncbi:tRNA (guanosine(46)-N7)-methyltransferase TrmB [Hujiaoplasma nucleasis]|uniref:tRNA (guanine-N(7)-)-methyltransferase n=1 Tax=Hujiaoplasma nucleasis TaxID=2725268 RepID=A0A7L6MZD4_9MOLU|nr:tRNA (guanosine(46)-N7)-methyltransferase TrmB [Hujiaoplasma nucleasis]QLY39350.1 tRNA (guanosine(46)-N7)-methyltransferase TrmB [Hujiaoplasma nucleasis]